MTSKTGPTRFQHLFNTCSTGLNVCCTAAQSAVAASRGCNSVSTPVQHLLNRSAQPVIHFSGESAPGKAVR